jgi:hypothetical protein
MGNTAKTKISDEEMEEILYVAFKKCNFNMVKAIREAVKLIKTRIYGAKNTD